MTDATRYLGPRLKEIRLKADLSLREVARQLSVSPSFVSQIENGKSQPSVATLYSFARLLGVPIDVLFDSQWGTDVSLESKINADQISRNNFETPTDAWDASRARISAVNPINRSLITMDSGVQWERLAATSEKSVNFMEIVYEPGAESNESGDLLIHDGFEYGYALEGEIEVTIGDLVLSLTKGHSIGFDSSIPHKLRNNGLVPFHGIWFVHGCAGHSS
jgi:transcriptional regulator with XRE-family HTH domain